MKTKTVKRYYCDFCGKGNGRANYMRLHEAHCTLNPNRLCRMCKAASGDECEVSAMPNLLITMPRPFVGDDNDPDYANKYGAWGDSVRKSLPALREAANNCPACILATLRQLDAVCHVFDLFNYKAEVESMWKDINAAEQEQHDY